MFQTKEQNKTSRGEENDKANRPQCKQLANLGKGYIGVPYIELVYKFQIL